MNRSLQPCFLSYAARSALAVGLALGVAGCGTVVAEQHFEVTSIGKKREPLAPRQTLAPRDVAWKDARMAVTVEAKTRCRIAHESVLKRDLVTTRSIDRSWYYPAPITGGHSFMAALAVVAYAATLGVIDKMRTRQTREPAEPRTRVDSIESRDCGSTIADDSAVHVSVRYYAVGEFGPAFAWSALGPTPRAFARTKMTDGTGRVTLDLPEAASAVLPHDVALARP